MALRLKIGIVGIALLAMALVLAPGAAARPTTPEQARQVVENWLSLETRPLGADMLRSVKKVAPYPDATGGTAYYVVSLYPQGLVIVPGDDLVEPIIGFSPDGSYDPSPANPLGALVSRDLPGRVAEARELARQPLGRGAREEAALRFQRKWAWLAGLSPDRGEAGQEFLRSISNPSDPLVDPLVQSKWDQDGVGGSSCYNYYTPNHLYSGCVATAMAQLMRYHQFPTTGIGVNPFTIYVYSVPQTAQTRGGDGSGGPYDWGNMALDPSTSGVNETQRQAIGSLTYDAGVSVNMNYGASGEGGSSSDTLKAAGALKSTFKYSNAHAGFNGLSNIPSDILYGMVNPNLDAGLPVLFGIWDSSSGGHAIVGDGYGYNLATMYHHLNMGWSGASDLWYYLPDINASSAFTSVYKCIYNVYKSGFGEIISGRVTDSCGAAISGANVTATRADGGDVIGTTSNARGIFTFANLPSNTTYTVSTAKAGHTFYNQTVSTGTSTDNSTICGNRWGINFVSGRAVGSPEYRLYNLAISGTSSRGFAINNQGKIVGAAKNTAGSFHAAYWEVPADGAPIRPIDLGTLGGYESEAHGINESGLIVGWSQKSGSNDKFPTNWFYNNGLVQIFQLATAHDNTNVGQALGVNNPGQITGLTWFYPPDAMLWACYWPGFDMMVQGLTSGTGSPRANRVNDQGVMVGAVNNLAARWDGGTLTNLDPSGTASEAFAPPCGTFPSAVGHYTNGAGNKVACIFDGPGSIRELGTLGGTQSTAYKVNTYSQIVGQGTNSAGRGRAFIWDQRQGMRDLNTLVNAPDWVLNTAYDINDNGEIVGWGYYKCVFDFAFILRPVLSPRDKETGARYLLLGD